MKHIVQKLRSRSGATLIIAMLFLLFCVFIGGSVLASASANGYRVAQLSKQQQYLDQRSAALLLADQLDTERAFQLIIKDVTTTKTLGKDMEEDWTSASAPGVERALIFTVNSEMSYLQRIMVESAILKNLGGNADNVSFRFEYKTGSGQAHIDDISRLWCYGNTGETPGNVAGSFSIDGMSDSWAFAQFSANYSCGDSYDFIVDFGDNSHLTITKNANSGYSEYDLPDQYDPCYIEDEAYVWKISKHMEYTVITWAAPQIEKGGEA